MNILSFEPLDAAEIGFDGFRLLVDGEPISNVPGCTFGELSYQDFDDELGTVEPNPNPRDCLRVLGVCDCGFYGCGATLARVTKADGKVRFHSFSGLGEGETPRELSFSEENYDEVMAKMRYIVSAFRDRNSQETAPGA